MAWLSHNAPTTDTVLPSGHGVRLRLVVRLLGMLVRRDLLVVDVRGGSMWPALRPGDRLFCSRRAPISEGAIVIRRTVDGRAARAFHIKRVVAMGREFDGRTIPPGHCWIEGDNSMRSADSRHFGPIPCSELVAVAVANLTRQGLIDLTL